MEFMDSHPEGGIRREMDGPLLLKDWKLHIYSINGKTNIKAQLHIKCSNRMCAIDIG